MTWPDWNTLPVAAQGALLVALGTAVSAVISTLTNSIAGRPKLKFDEGSQLRDELRKDRDADRIRFDSLEERHIALVQSINLLRAENRQCLEAQSVQRIEIGQVRANLTETIASLAAMTNDVVALKSELLATTKERDDWKARAIALDAQITRALRDAKNSGSP